MKNTLKQRAVLSGKWVIIGQLCSQLLRLISNLTLTRLLIPEMFGVMAIVSTFMMGIALFSDVGLQQSVTQSKHGENREFLNTAWCIQIIQGIALFLVALVLSFIIYILGANDFIDKNSVYGHPDIPYLLILVSISSLLAGFNSINLMLLNRRLMIGRAIAINIFSQICGLIIMILAAWYYREVWTLAFGGGVATIIKLVLSHHQSLGDRNKLMWDKNYATEIFHVGKWIFVGSILGFILSQGDKLLLALWISPAEFGVYTVAFFLSMALKQLIQQVISSVFYPMLSEIVRTNKKALKATYYNIRKKIDFVVMAVGGLMVSSGHIFIDLLYDERYVNAGWIIETLSLSIIFLGYSLAGTCLMALGKVKQNTYLILLSTVFLYITVPLGYHFYGYEGAVIMIALNLAVDIPATFFMMKKHKLLDLKKEFIMVPVFFIFYSIGEIIIK
jgi:O-antigen/teichoic acid export membrane protein